MKRLLTITIIFITVFNLFSIIQYNVSATSIFDGNLFIYRPEDKNIPQLVNKANIVLTVIRAIGIVIAVIALMLIGFKMMLGSVEEKSDLKKALPGYIIGVIMVVAVTVLPTIIYELVKGMEII